jgi:hypothetical protein
VIDRRKPAFHVPAFYVTPREHATPMALDEAFRRALSNEELGNQIRSGVVVIEAAESVVDAAICCVREFFDAPDNRYMIDDLPLIEQLEQLR